MVKNEANRGCYSEEYDGEALRELINMSKLYVAKEIGFTGVGQDVPDGTFSDFSCSVWEMLNECVRYGMWLQRRKSKKEQLEKSLASFRRCEGKYEQKLNEFSTDWRRPVCDDEDES